MKTVLMIAPYFPPRKRVGSLRPFKFAIHLRDYGWKPVVLSLKTPGAALTAHEEKLLDGIDIITVSAPFDRTLNQKKNQPKTVEKKKSLLNLNLLSDWVDKQIPADSWLPLFLFKYRSILKDVKMHSPKLIWCTGDPWSGLWLGEKLAGDLNLPLISDLRDPWTLANINLRKRSSLSEIIDERIEKRIITKSDHLVFTAKSTLDKYVGKYQFEEKKCSVIYNSFSERLSQNNEVSEWSQKLSPEKFHLLFLGQFRRLSPAISIINAVDEFKKNHPKLSERLLIHSFGELEVFDANEIAKRGLQSHFIQHERVAPEHVASVQNQVDLLLLSSHPERDLIVPAKLWDYLQSDKMILSISTNSEVGDILQSSDRGVQFNPDDTQAISDFLADLVQKKIEGEMLSAKSNMDLTHYESEYTTSQLTSLMDSITN